jgi:hypothetical protein
MKINIKQVALLSAIGFLVLSVIYSIALIVHTVHQVPGN